MFLSDLAAGVTVGLIALPLAIGSGIAVIIFVGQLKEFFGLTVEKWPQHTPHQIATVVEHIGQANWAAVGVGALALAILILWPKIKGVNKIPASIIAIVVPTVVVA